MAKKKRSKPKPETEPNTADQAAGAEGKPSLCLPDESNHDETDDDETGDDETGNDSL
jgi:hypothetical protein